MKKILVCAMTLMALTFAACGNKQSANVGSEDSAAVDTTAVSGIAEEAEALASDLKAKLEANDSKGFNDIVESAKQKIDELVKEGKVEEAKAYASKVKQFVDENAETIKQVTNGNATINSIVDAIKDLPSNAEEAVDAAGNAVKSDAENAVQSVKDAADTKVKEVKEDTKAKANEAVDNAKKKANDAVDKAASKALNKLGL